MKAGKMKKTALYMLAIVCAMSSGFLTQNNVSAAEMKDNDYVVSTNAVLEGNETDKETDKEIDMIEETAAMRWDGYDYYGAETPDEIFARNKSYFDNAPLLQIGATVTGHTYDTDSMELYRIEIPESGELYLDCGENYSGQNMYTYMVFYYNPHCNHWEIGGSWFNAANPWIHSEDSIIHFAEKGTYYIGLSVRNEDFEPIDTYRLTASFVPFATDKREPNDTFATASTIEMNRSFVGIQDGRIHYMAAEPEVGDNDYLKFYFPGGDLYIYDFAFRTCLICDDDGYTIPVRGKYQYVYSGLYAPLLNENKELLDCNGNTYSTGGTGNAWANNNSADKAIYDRPDEFCEYYNNDRNFDSDYSISPQRFHYKNLPAGTYYIQYESDGLEGRKYEIFVTDNSSWDFWLSKSRYALECLKNWDESEYWKNYTPSYVDAGQVSAFINRLYDLCFGRKADETGFADWNNALMSRNKTAAEVARGFFLSVEMKNRNLSDAEFVELLYQVMMNRSFDEGGRQYWLDSLTNGVSREFVYRGFAESQEFSNLCNSYGIERGTVTLGQYRDKNMQATGFIARLYTKMLGRSFDEDGLEYWCRLYLTGEKTIENIAGDGFLHSEELKNQNLSDEEFVRRMYQTFLNREPEEAGLKDWIGRLSRGEETRDSLVYGFTNSPEFGKLKAEYNLP